MDYRMKAGPIVIGTPTDKSYLIPTIEEVKDKIKGLSKEDKNIVLLNVVDFYFPPKKETDVHETSPDNAG